MRNTKGQFVKGISPENHMPVGTIRIRTRHKRYGVQRAWIKVAEPNQWILLAHHVWHQHHGLIPCGMGLHHADENTLNDAIENLELVTKKTHLALHRAAFHDKAMAAFAAARRQLRWSTKSLTKRVGRHPRSCHCPIHASRSKSFPQ